MKSKTCIKCGEDKLLTKFYFNNSRMMYMAACKECIQTQQRENRKHNHPRRCSKCGKTKPITEFYFNNNLIRHSSVCKECSRTRSREYKRTHPRKKRTKAERRKEYITQCKKLGSDTRFALLNLFEGSYNGLRKCTKCKQYKPPSEFWKDLRNTTGHRSQCKNCSRTKKTSRRTRALNQTKHAKTRLKIQAFPTHLLNGDGCCLYCGQIDPFNLEDHHPWKKEDPHFTTTLCTKHHNYLTKNRPFLLNQWH